MDGQDFLKKTVKRIIEIEDEETKLKNMLNKIKEEKDVVNNNLIQFMETNNITDKDIVIGSKKIKYATSKNTESITKKLIYDRLKVFLKSEKAAEDAVDYIYSDRGSTTKSYIKISDVK